MKVANVIEEGKLGGPQIRITRVAAILKSHFKTTVVMPVENSIAFQLRCESCSVAYLKLPVTRITKEPKVAIRYILFFFPEILRLFLVFRKNRFDLIHVSGGSWQFKGVIAGKLARKTVLWHLNDTAMPGFIRRLFEITSRLADGFIFASERSRNYYLPLIRKGRPQFVIPAPVDTTLFSPNSHLYIDDDITTTWADQFVIGTVCNINPIKGLECFLRAAALLNERIGHAQFVVVGPIYKNQKRYFDSLKQLCIQLQIDNIHFVGGRSDVRPLLARFDTYVCSSRAESSPMAVWEAMAMAKPVVSTDVGDVPFYVKEGVNGFIVPVDEPDLLADRLYALSLNEQMRSQFGEQARKTVVRHLGIKQCAELHAQAYSAMSNSTNS